jgi:hypothetical protein
MTDARLEARQRVKDEGTCRRSGEKRCRGGMEGQWARGEGADLETWRDEARSRIRTYSGELSGTLYAQHTTTVLHNGRA